MKPSIVHLLHLIRAAVAAPVATAVADEVINGDFDAHTWIGIGVAVVATVWGWLGTEIRKLEARYPISS